MKKFLIFLTIFISAAMLTFWGLLEVFAVEINEKIPDIYIRAVNPGYTVDGKSNVGEMIEIGYSGSDDRISLAGLVVGYTNSSGNKTVLFEFPENSWMLGERIVLRLASSPGNELAAANYTRTLAFKGGISLEFDEKILDEVCWNGKEGCFKEFKSGEMKSLVRNLETGEFEYVVDYVPVYDEKSYLVEEAVVEPLASQCKGLVFSEVLSYYESSQSEQFVEIYNSGSEQVLMDGCQMKYKNKVYGLSGVLKPEGYFAYFPAEFSLTKNPTNAGVLELVDANGEILDKLEYPNGQRKGTSYALIGYDGSGGEIWRTTYKVTAGEANIYQEFKSCEEGKVLNKETGNCVKVASVSEKVCQEGYYLNGLTGRCNKIKTVAEVICNPGYEKNPETGRCRKIKENTGAKYSLESENYQSESEFAALYAVIGVVVLGLGYLGFEFRTEILKLCRKVFRRAR